MKRTLPVVMAVALLAAAVATADEVHVDGRRVTGRIKVDNYEKVVLSQSGRGEMDWQQNRIERITYQEAPLSMVSGLSSFRAGEFEVALDRLTKAQEDLEKKAPQIGSQAPLILQYILYHKAVCLDKAGEQAEALKTYEALLETIPDTKFLQPTAEWLFSYYASKGNYDKVEAILPKLEKLGHEPGLRAGLFRANILERKEQWRKARRTYEDVGRDASRFPPIAAESEIGIARCLLATGDVDGAIKRARAVLGQAEKLSPSVLAKVHMMLGEAYFAKARGKDPKHLKKALFEFLRIPVLYGANSPKFKEAVERSAACLDALELRAEAAKVRRMF